MRNEKMNNISKNKHQGKGRNVYRKATGRRKQNNKFYYY